MFFGPKNSIIVPFDYSTPTSFEDFENQLEAIKEHYRFAKLTQIIQAIKNKKRQGYAAIVLENPRKGVFLHAIPTLLSMEIPFTLFLDPDYLGLNRLPLEEELRAYHRSYPERFSKTEFHEKCELARRNPEEADVFLRNCRKILGPLRVDEMDSLQFFTTWGKVLDIPPDRVEFGLLLNHEISSSRQVQEKMSFCEKQIRRTPTLVRASKWGFSEKEIELLKESRVESVLGHDVRDVTKDTNVFNLPIWKLNG